MRRVVYLALSAVIFSGGCGDGGGLDGLDRQPVSGTVSRQGKPLESAQIVFSPTSSGPTASTDIKGGKYYFTRSTGPIAGTYNVKILQDSKRHSDAAPKGTRPKDMPVVDPKNAAPAGGWKFDAEVLHEHAEPLDFNID